MGRWSNQFITTNRARPTSTEQNENNKGNHLIMKGNGTIINIQINLFAFSEEKQ